MDSKILDKIKKCLALAKSDNPNEAATALRQAQALMDKHGVTREALELSDVQAHKTKSGAGKTPPSYINMLVHLIKEAFAVEVVFKSSYNFFDGYDHSVEFIGMNGSPEVAGYAYEVLLRQLKKGRADHLKTLSKRLKRVTKTLRGDLYAQGWISSVHKQIVAQPIPEKESAIIQRWKDENYSNLTTLKTKDRTDKARSHDVNSFYQGKADGEKVNFHSGVKADQRIAIGGGA